MTNVPCRRPRSRAGRARLVAAVLAVGVVVSVPVGCGGASTTKTVRLRSVRTVTTVVYSQFGPRAAAPSELKIISEVLAQPIYWAGPKPGFTYEISRAANGNVFLRYLPQGTAVGAKPNKKAPYLVIATYPVSDAYEAVVRASKKKGSVGVKIPNKGLAVYATTEPATYYFAYPDARYQVGVFAPTAAEARKLVLRARVLPVS
jgi:hypothetical protein